MLFEGAAEREQWLRALAALAEDPDGPYLAGVSALVLCPVGRRQSQCDIHADLLLAVLCVQTTFRGQGNKETAPGTQSRPWHCPVLPSHPSPISARSMPTPVSFAPFSLPWVSPHPIAAWSTIHSPHPFWTIETASFWIIFYSTSLIFLMHTMLF